MTAQTAEYHRDDRLAQLLADLSQEQARQQALDWEKIGRDHPDLVDELRQLLAVGQVVDVLAQPLPSTSSTVFSPRFPPAGPEKSPENIPQALGDYDILEELGRGGMGIVFKAWDRRLKRHVALKTILQAPHASAGDLDRFRAEAQAAAGLNHPNIVPVYQVGEENGQAFFCMEYVEGRTLANLIKSGPLPQRQAARYLAAIARAVQHAHEKGILHRDLKPTNILLTGTRSQEPGARSQESGARKQEAGGRGQEAGKRRPGSGIGKTSADVISLIPKITDFGLAKRVEGGANLTGTGAILGTPSYMAPEQAMGMPSPSPATDIYSLGAILYEMLTGRPPFLAATAVDTLLLVRSEEPVRLRLLNPRVDPDLEFVCNKCLEKWPEHRYSSAAQLADDLEAFLQGEPVSARSNSLIYFFDRLFRETYHAPVLENWGLLWMWHSLQVLLLCGVTSLMYWLGARGHFPDLLTGHLPYLLLWSIGLVLWGAIFMHLRRRGGPVTFVERQIMHLWAGGVIASIAIFLVEVLLDLPVLVLTPILAVVNGMIFLGKAGTLSGWFYLPAALSFFAAIPIAWLGPPLSPLVFGFVSAVSFFVPGLKYYRQRLRGEEKWAPEMKEGDSR